jgi:molybdopterin converting factor small subunit
MVRLRMFAAAREAAGRADDSFEAQTLGEVLAAARARYGEPFGAVLDASRVWVNGEEPTAGDGTPLRADDEVAVLPPVSGGCGRARRPARPGPAVSSGRDRSNEPSRSGRPRPAS